MLVYRNRQFRISKKHPLYGYCDTVTALCCNLENAVRFRQRQVLTAVPLLTGIISLFTVRMTRKHRFPASVDLSSIAGCTKNQDSVESTRQKTAAF